MNTENHSTNPPSQEYHQSYVEARRKQGMFCIDDYDKWLAKKAELAQLEAQNGADTWENSEHNPTNYPNRPDWDSLDDETKQQRIIQGKQDYWADSKALEDKISELRHLLTHPDELIRDTDSEDDSEPNEYWAIND